MSETPPLRTDTLTIPQGSTYKVQWPIRDSDGNPVPLTGWTARAQARVRIDSVDALDEWTTEDGSITLADSTLTMNFDHDQTSAWTWRTARYDVELVSPTGSPTRLSEGAMYVSPEVTR